jgi:hypothetical protein
MFQAARIIFCGKTKRKLGLIKKRDVRSNKTAGVETLKSFICHVQMRLHPPARYHYITVKIKKRHKTYRRMDHRAASHAHYRQPADHVHKTQATAYRICCLHVYIQTLSFILITGSQHTASQYALCGSNATSCTVLWKNAFTLHDNKTYNVKCCQNLTTYLPASNC